MSGFCWQVLEINSAKDGGLGVFTQLAFDWELLKLVNFACACCTLFFFKSDDSSVLANLDTVYVPKVAEPRANSVI